MDETVYLLGLKILITLLFGLHILSGPSTSPAITWLSPEALDNLTWSVFSINALLVIYDSIKRWLILKKAKKNTKNN